MSLLEVASRPDRHADLLRAAESFAPTALIYFERGGEANLRRANEMALAIKPVPGGDIGWQIVDVAIMLTRHAGRLTPAARAHLADLLQQALAAWADRDFGRGNVNHPVIATWLYAAAGAALGQPEYSQIADQRFQRFIHLFSQAGDMSEYNSPTYLGPTLVGLANIATYAELHSTRLRARLIEERIWLSAMARWHPPTQQLAGPHSRAYADNTIGFGGIFRYLAHAVLDAPVFWDPELSVAYDHGHDAEWATKIAASVFDFPDYLRAIGEAKRFPYPVLSDTDCEDYTVDGREIYRGGWGALTTYLTPLYCLGSSERPYVDGGQTEMCIAYWRRRQPVKEIADIRALYFRYVANERLPGQANAYYSWYGGREMTYSANLLHQDGRQHTLQHRGKVILLAQPVRRENGRLRSLRLDALLPLYAPLNEIWVGEQQVESVPVVASWESPVMLRDGDIFVAIRPLRPTDLGGAQPAVQIVEANRHLIISIYNLRSDEPRAFLPYVLDTTHNGLILELASAGEYGDFADFRRYIASAAVTESNWMGEVREVRYRSGPDELRLRYNPATQEVLRREVNGRAAQGAGFACPHAAQGLDGRLRVGEVSLETAPDVPAWLVHDPITGWVVAALPTDLRASLRLATPAGVIESDSFTAGRIRFRPGCVAELEVDRVAPVAPLRIRGVSRIGRATLNGRDASQELGGGANGWVLP